MGYGKDEEKMENSNEEIPLYESDFSGSRPNLCLPLDCYDISKSI
jgi:hypothetical protein